MMSHEERTELISDIVSAVRNSEPVLTSDEIQYVRMAIKREAQSIAFRNAIIEKSLTGLVWAAIIGLGYIIKEWLNTHGLKV